MANSEKQQRIIRAAIDANPDIDPVRIAKIVKLVLTLAYSRKILR